MIHISSPLNRDRLRALETASDPIVIVIPVFLRGGAWEKTDEWIGLYGDLDTDLAWKFLDANLLPGSTFTFPLAAGAVLTVWVVRIAPVDTPLGTFGNAVWCVYRLDSGILCSSTVFHPEPHGCQRIVYAGRVVYAPTVGPVYLYERVHPLAGDPEGRGWGDTTLELVGIRSGG